MREPSDSRTLGVVNDVLHQLVADLERGEERPLAYYQGLYPGHEETIARKYAELIESHRDTEPIKLPTETALLLFLSAVELKEQIEMDRWGQELKRRHGDAEVRDWVNEMTRSAR